MQAYSLSPAEMVLFAAAAGVTAVILTLVVVLFYSRGSRRSSDSISTGELQGRLNELERISRHLEELRTLFILPRTRGDVGETLLAELLKNWLPQENYSLQYGFSNGGRADAVIHLGNYMVAVDAKFPLQSVRDALIPADSTETVPEVPAQIKRTFIQHARDIASKYIRPDEGTLQFALMYIPSESLYYRCFVEDSRLSAAVLEQKIIPASPSTLFLYIQTVAYGLRGFRFSRKTEQMIARLFELQTELRSFEKNLGTTATHLKNLTNAFDSLTTNYRRVDTLMQEIDKE
ncbi:MAG: DNA recombination protein RmuC [Sediminispirochaetaceae bacterium]